VEIVRNNHAYRRVGRENIAQRPVQPLSNRLVHPWEQRRSDGGSLAFGLGCVSSLIVGPGREASERQGRRRRPETGHDLGRFYVVARQVGGLGKPSVPDCRFGGDPPWSSGIIVELLPQLPDVKP
jgi:hypothetical protein